MADDKPDSTSSINSKKIVNGGLTKDNPYYNWLELNAQEEGTGRDLLRRTSPVTDSEMLIDEGVDRIMGAVSPVGTDGLRTSKWSKK